MKLTYAITASALGLTACGAIQPGQKTDAMSLEVPIEKVRKAHIEEDRDNGSPKDRLLRRAELHKKIVNPLDPIIAEQQRLWDCITAVDSNLFLDCAEQIAVSADCTDAKMGKLVDRYDKIPECHNALLTRKEGQSIGKLEKIFTAEQKCVDKVLLRDSAALNGFSPCYSDEIACLKGVVASGIVCSLQEQEARL